jgi:transcriptional regulator with XRE-family HTH domain
MSTQPQWVPEDTFGTRLVILRRQLGLSVEEMAERCGQKAATWSTWERGAAPRSMASVVAAISLATGVSRDWLMWGGPLSTEPPDPGRRGEGSGLPRLDSNQKPPGLRSASWALALVA